MARNSMRNIRTKLALRIAPWLKPVDTPCEWTIGGVDDEALLHRNGWRHEIDGEVHIHGWWFHEGWNWLPKGQALALSKDWDQGTFDKPSEVCWTGSWADRATR